MKNVFQKTLGHCLLSALLGTAGLLAMPVQAQIKVEVAGVGSNQIPIAVAAFADENIAPQQVSEIIRNDLERSGYFRIIAAPFILSETSSVNFSEWKSRGAEALVVGSVSRLADGRFEVRYKLYDTLKAATLSGYAVAVLPQNTRQGGHKVADDVYEKLTGVPGVFSTRISYVTKNGPEYRLEVADADGENVKVALRSMEPIMSPAWSPDGSKVAYVSFEARKPIVMMQNLVTGERYTVANYKGNNSAPAWSPDGSRLAVVLSKDGIAQIYTVNARGGSLQRMTTSSAIDTEPQFSADGQYIYFLSDRGGGPQIYRMSAGGGDAQRVTFNGNYNISPRISPDGKNLAYISRRDGKFQLYTLDLASGQELRLSDTTNDEFPSFAPNGRYIMYATESGRRGSLAVVSLDGKIKQKLTVQTGDIRQPTWGPYMK